MARIDDIDVLARTIWGEARGESISGQEAIASVVMNRVAFSKRRGRYWWGNTVTDVCQAPWQFSCWNKTDPNYQKLIKVGTEDINFCMCRRIAERAVNGTLEDKTCGATHYHTRNCFPAWACDKKPCAEVGAHLFYNNIEK